MKLSVFDSGIGGEAIAEALRREFPNADIMAVNDRAHMPYGDKTAEEIQALTDTAIQPLLGRDVIVIACNSATTAAIDFLRANYPKQKFIGIEPMIKSAAALTKTGIIAVCATPATLKSSRYQELKTKFAQHVSVLEPDCSTWAKMIEDNDVNETLIAREIEQALAQNADVIVLGCTHYHWIKDEIEQLAHSRATVLEPSEAIGRRVKDLLEL